MWATDRLTLLLDRWGWDEQAPEIVEHRGPVALLVVDLDNFKRVNDRFGHVAGDEVLKAVADTLRRTTRKGDLLGRYGGQGGDEFLVLLPETGPEDAHAVAERIRMGVRSMVVQAPTSSGTKTITAITASVGVATGTPDMDLQSLVVAADNALREAKRGGRDKVRASGVDQPGKWRKVPLRLAVLGACAVGISFVPVIDATPKPVEQSAAAETATPAPTTAPPLPTVTVPTTVTATTTVPPRTVVVAAPKPKKTPTSEQPAARNVETPPATTRRPCPMCDLVNGLMPRLLPMRPR
jgi:diguanylate cyclase (GGDEF)-like protein